MERDRAGGPRSTPWRRLLALSCGAVLFGVLGYVSRSVVIDRDAQTLIWPASGLAALWLGLGTRQTRLGVCAALGVATFTVNLATGLGPGVSAAFTVANVTQVALFVTLAARWTHVWGLGGTEPLHRLGDLGRLVVAAVTACFVGAMIGASGLVVFSDGVTASAFEVWWGRNSVSLIIVTTFGLLAGPPLFAARDLRDLGRILYRSVHAHSVRRLVEAELLVAVSIGLYAVLFGQRTGQPLAFLVLAVSVWAGLRFSPIAVMSHGLAMGVLGLAFTLHGSGPFASIESTHFRALVAQLFIATTVLTGLSLAFSREERDRANRDLARARRQADERAGLLSAVLESMSEGLVVIEDGGRVLVSNTASKQLLGLDSHSDTAPPVAYRLFHEDGTPVSATELPATRALDGEEVEPTDFQVRTGSVPEGRVLEIGARPLTTGDPAGRARAIMNIRDVTLDRQHRDALASFAGVVAHDLFNPLTIVTGWAEALEEEFESGAVDASVGLPMLARMSEAASHMRHVIGDLLAYTVARDQSLRPTAVDLTAELRSLALLRIDGPGHPVITVAPGLSAWVDPGLARQLFDNLLGNAVKYVAPGVRPLVEVRGRRDGDWLEVRVSDNGIGIPEDQREQVFETFHRAHAQGYQGTGLGLAICRRIADRHGGSIHAESVATSPDDGRTGTTFVVMLPATAAAYAATPALPRPTQAPRPQPVTMRSPQSV